MQPLLPLSIFFFERINFNVVPWLNMPLIEAPVLALPDFKEPFILETDASRSAMGVMLMQKSHLIAFFGKVFCPRLQKASTYVRELHAITITVLKW